MRIRFLSHFWCRCFISTMLDLGVFDWLCVLDANPCLREWEKALEWRLGVFMKWNPVCYMHSKTGPRYKQNLPQRQNLVHEGDFSQALTNSIFSLVESLKFDSWVRRLWSVRFIEFHQMCCVRQRKQRFAHFWEDFSIELFFLWWSFDWH